MQAGPIRWNGSTRPRGRRSLKKIRERRRGTAATPRNTSHHSPEQHDDVLAGAACASQHASGQHSSHAGQEPSAQHGQASHGHAPQHAGVTLDDERHRPTPASTAAERAAREVIPTKARRFISILLMGVGFMFRLRRRVHTHDADRRAERGMSAARR